MIKHTRGGALEASLPASDGCWERENHFFLCGSCWQVAIGPVDDPMPMCV